MNDTAKTIVQAVNTAVTYMLEQVPVKLTKEQKEKLEVAFLEKFNEELSK